MALSSERGGSKPRPKEQERKNSWRSIGGASNKGGPQHPRGSSRTPRLQLATIQAAAKITRRPRVGAHQPDRHVRDNHVVAARHIVQQRRAVLVAAPRVPGGQGKMPRSCAASVIACRRLQPATLVKAFATLKCGHAFANVIDTSLADKKVQWRRGSAYIPPSLQLPPQMRRRTAVAPVLRARL